MEPLNERDPRTIGPYAVIGRLGSGGMGVVYLGRSGGGRTVAVKVVHAELADDPGFRRRFRREIAAVRSVSGAFTAAVVDADPDDPTPWLATAFIPGVALSEAVAAHGPLAESAVRTLGIGLGEALTAIHRAGVTHRDLKPSNVLLAPDGPHVIDFGISRTAEGSTLTDPGSVVGSAHFMAPEQARGERIGPPADVFSLAATLVFAATGSGPFGSGPLQAVLYRVISAEPDLEHVPPALGPVLRAALTKDPAVRPSVARFVSELGERGGLGEFGELAESEPGHADRSGNWLPPAYVREIAAAGAVLTAAAAVTPSPADEGHGPVGRTQTAPVTRPAPTVRANARPTPMRPALTSIPAPGNTDRRKLLIVGGGLLAAATAGVGFLAWDGGGGTSPGSSGADTASTSKVPTDDAPVPSDTAPAPMNTVANTGRLTSTRTLQPTWTYQAADTIRSVFYSGGAVYIQSSHGVQKLSIDTGTPQWTSPAGGGTPVVLGACPLAAAGDSIYASGATDSSVGGTSDSISRINIADGSVYWQCSTGSGSTAYGVAGVLDRVVYSIVEQPEVGTSSVWAISADTHKILWQQSASAELLLVPPSGGLVYASTTAFGGPGGSITALRTTDGSAAWSSEGASATVGDGLSTGAPGACYAVGRILVPGAPLTAVDPLSGKTGWTFSARSAADYDVPVSDGGSRVFVIDGGSGDLFGVDAGTGKQLWKTVAANGLSTVNGTITYADGVLYVADGSGGLYGVDPRTGGCRWQYNNAESGDASMLIAAGSGLVYLATDTTLTALTGI